MLVYVQDDVDGDVKMGETDDAMHYDPDSIFRHLYAFGVGICAHRGSADLSLLFRCFYLDSPQNARRHGMSVRGRHEKEIDTRFVCLYKF